MESKYPESVLTEGETATFAGLSANTTTGRVNDMALDIEVGEGEDLEIGVKSGYGIEDNNTAGANHGKFYIDLVRTRKVSDLPVTYDENSSTNEIVPHTYNNKVVLNKQFVNNEWQFVCFPFSLNAADIETIFGKGTKVEQLEILEIDVKTYKSPSEGETDEDRGNDYDEHDGLLYRIVNEMKAGCPYLIHPTDALASPIVMEHVHITRDDPWIYGHEYYTITGTFQRTDEAPAFSAILTYTDPSGINEIQNSKFKIQNEGTWYDLSGKPITQLEGARNIHVTKGRKVLK